MLKMLLIQYRRQLINLAFNKLWFDSYYIEDSFIKIFWQSIIRVSIAQRKGSSWALTQANLDGSKVFTGSALPTSHFMLNGFVVTFQPD